jgi:NAD(P)-dependent dehydrogenase (short-subunit alcohol dehydrogenase family)
MTDLSGRTAFVTAGSRGIGRAICLQLAEAGADVALNYQSNHQAAAEVAAQIQAKGRRVGTYKFDVADWEACQTGVSMALSELGRIDILVNNAGLGGSTIGFPSILSVTMEQFHRLMDVNLWGTVHMCKLLVEQMRDAERADIIMISSSLAQMLTPNQGPYSTSKAGMEALGHTLAKEEYPYGTRVNIVAPGLVETEMGRLNLEQRPPSVREQNTVFGQMVQPEDVANAVVFLCSDQGHLITDQRITVDGGAATRRPPV